MEFYIGQTASHSSEVTDSAIRLFATASGDDNPVHLDEEYAKQSMFGRRIAHGMLTASFISAILGTKLPGYGTIYLSQSISFKKPVYLGDVIETVVTVTGIIPEKRLLELETVCKNQNGEVVLEGKALVKAPK